MSLSERFDNPLSNRKIQRTISSIFRELHAEVDLSDGDYDSNCSVGVVINSSEDEFCYSSDFSEEAEDFEELCVSKRGTKDTRGTVKLINRK